MNAAVGAALVSMVCNLTIGKPRYAEHEQTMTAALERATTLGADALRLAGEAFEAVAAAYKLPRDTDSEKQARTAAIQSALLGAADVPLRTAELAAEVVELAGRILDGANVNVVSDVAAAASSARAALEAAAINVEINLAAMANPTRRTEIARALSKHTPACPTPRTLRSTGSSAKPPSPPASPSTTSPATSTPRRTSTAPTRPALAASPPACPPTHRPPPQPS
jgi:formiminotetrahydrofolate cyclodeaminase